MVEGRNFTFGGFISLISIDSPESESSLIILSSSLNPTISPLVLGFDFTRGRIISSIISSGFFGIACGMVDYDLLVELSFIISSSRE